MPGETPEEIPFKKASDQGGLTTSEVRTWKD
jgi:hypothetical protein